MPGTREILSGPAGEVVLIHAGGRLDTAGTPSLEAEFAEVLAAGQTRLIVDLADVTYISSSGLRALLSVWRRARAKGGDVILSGMRPRVREVFEMVGFDQVFTIGGTTEEALAALSARSTAS